jgi:hypothetical protein
MIPCPRTYHASCLLDKYMIVSGGESNGDLKDLWMYDLEYYNWIKPQILFNEHYSPK